MKELITVLTPVYNRREKLNKLYESLCDQNVKNFVWLIIDDGSTDNLYTDIETMMNNSPFDIVYKYKENGGKHTALNIGADMLETELVFIVDSDDVLTDDATQVIQEEWEKIKDDTLAGMVFLKGYSNGEVIGDRFPGTGIFNDIDIRSRYRVKGDKAEIWKSDILKQHKFPVFDNEKYQGENYVWQKIAFEYDMMYINRIIYIAEYLEDGLTKTGRILKIKSPLGAMENAKISFDKRFPLRKRVKNALLFICYGKFAGKSYKEIVKESDSAVLIEVNYIFGYLLYLYWKHKYL